MQSQLDTLQQQLQTIQQFERLFASFNKNDLSQFNLVLGEKNQEGSFIHYMNNPTNGMNTANKLHSAFNGFDFPAEDERANLVKETIGYIRKIVPQEQNTQNDTSLPDGATKPTSMVEFVNLLIAAVRAKHLNSNSVVFLFSQLIALQKTAILASIQAEQQKLQGAEKQKAEDEISIPAEAASNTVHDAQTPSAKRGTVKVRHPYNQQLEKIRKTGGYLLAGTAVTSGAVTTTFSALLHFSPKFAMLVGLHLAPATLATLAVSGVVMAAVGVYAAYRTYNYNPDAAVTNPAPAEIVVPVAGGYSKLLTAVIARTGLSMMTFSALTTFSPALMQFSPKFALLMGLHLQPAALIAIAAVGMLLLSVALYRSCKGHAPASEPVVEVTVATEPTTCMQRLSQYKDYCLKLFFSTPPENEGVVDGNDTTHDMNDKSIHQVTPIN